jgi:PhnB protein
MTKMNVYLNFMGKTEEAFEFYRSVFGGEFEGGIARMKDVPGIELGPEDENKVMHVALRIGNDILMGTDAVESMGHSLTIGNNISISLHPESKEEADRLFQALSDGGAVEMPIQDMFWGDYFGAFADRYGVRWMINYTYPKA